MGSHNRVLLIGMMGVGKSTVGHAVAQRLGWPYLDSDEWVERHTGKTVPEIFESEGEPAFRAQEAAALQEAATSDGPLVVGVAGGAVIDAQNRALIRNAGLVVWLRADILTLAKRVGDGHGRPLLGDDPEAALKRLYPERRPLYEGLAHMAVDVDQRSPGEIADEIVGALTTRDDRARS
ncbi:MAG: shikimate kinase [Acidimicrobiaceae bacterium]|jgi:shikimate kinase|nr:shikimate kinase [Acidimicrobiaceae bacterium]